MYKEAVTDESGLLGEEEEKRPGNERKRSLGGEAHGYCARTDEHRIFDCTSKN
jgi:hypothetical protein